MKIFEILSIAFLAIKTNKVRSILTMLGVIIGVSSVILLVSLGSGIEKTILVQFEKLGANMVFVMPGRLGEGGSLAGSSGMGTNKLEFDDVKIIEKIEGVEAVASGIEGIATVEYKGEKRRGVVFFGTTANFSEVMNYNVSDGRFFTKSEAASAKRVVIVGQTIVDELLETKKPLGKEINVRGQRYKIIGVLEEQGSIAFTDIDNIVVVPTEAARRQLGFDRPNEIYAKVEDKNDVPIVKGKIEKVLLKRLTEDDFTVLTPEETLSVVQTILGVLSVALGGIAGISLIVGGVGISNIMLVSVRERTREIGLRKAVGATPQDILIQFLIEAVTLSFIGGIIGLAVSISGAYLISQFIPAVITSWSVTIALGFSFIVGIVFGVGPAWRASRMNPIDALRFE